MSIHKKTSIAFLSLSMCLPMAQKAFADRYLNSMPVKEQWDGSVFTRLDVQKAIAALARSLGLNPNNKTAQENLNLIAEIPSLDAPLRSDIYRIQDMFNTINGLSARIDHYKQKRELLKSRLIEQGHDVHLMNSQLMIIKSHAHRPFIQPMMRGEIGLDTYGALSYINELVIGEYDHMALELNYLEEQYRWLSGLTDEDKSYREQQDIAEFPITDHQRMEEEIYVYKNDVPLESVSAISVDEMANQTVEAKPAKLQILNPLRAERAVMTDPVELHAMIERKDVKIEDLIDQVVGLSLQVSEMEYLLNQKVDEISSLRRNLTEVEQRFMLEQRIIQEKNAEIKNLQESLNQPQPNHSAQNDSVSKSRDEKLIELSEMLEIYKHKLSEKHHLAEQKADIISEMERQLERMKGDLAEKESALAKTQSDLMKLKEQIINIQSEVNRMEQYPDEVNSQPTIGSQVRHLQTQFQDIQHFLLENVRDSDTINTQLIED